MAAVEQWRPVVGFEGLYEVSDQGRVRSLGRTIMCFRAGYRPHTKTYQPKLMRGTLACTYDGRYYGPGYFAVTLTPMPEDNKAVSIRLVHNLVLEAFLGRRPTRAHEGAHEDGNSHNNVLGNLAWKLPKENTADTIKHGRHISTDSRRIQWRKLSPAKVRAIRRACAAGASRASQGRKYGVCGSHISEIVNGKRGISV